jgi:hypothetical protein
MSEQDREQRNAVFNQPLPPGVQPGMPRTTANERAKADFGLEVAQEIAPLPSCGKTYPQGSSLCGAETVDIKAMTTKEENILTSTALVKKGTAITELIRACLIDRSIDPLDLLSGDRNALMVAIRVTGYGPVYEVEMECSECENKSPRTFDLSALPIKRLEVEPVIPNTNLFEFKLPFTGKLVKFKFMTGRDEEDMMAMSNKQKKLGMKSDSTITTSLIYTIVSIDGQEDRSKITNFVNVMPARDSLALRNYIRDIEPGILMRQEVTCPLCGETEEVGMPLGITFLWPSAKR